MPTLFRCDNCGVKSWNRKPGIGGELLSGFVMRDKTYCPVCGHDFGLVSDKPVNQKKEAKNDNSDNETEREDAEKVDMAVDALANGNITTARKLLEEVVANAPLNYSYSYQDDNQLFIKFWNLEEFLTYTSLANTGLLSGSGTVLWVKSAYPRAYYLIAFLDVETGYYQSAITHLNSCLKLEPDQPQALYELGIVYGKLKQFEKAIDFFDKAIKARFYAPSSVIAKCLRQKGVNLIDLGDLEKATESLLESLEYEPANSLALNELIYIKELRSEGALKEGNLFRGTRGNYTPVDNKSTADVEQKIKKETPKPELIESTLNKKKWWQFWK